MSLLDRIVRAVFGEPPTRVYLRSTRCPAQMWENRVRYDAWGTPYTERRDLGSSSASWGVIVLRPNGKTDQTHLYGTEWRHKSGPPVDFRDPPKSPFPNATDPSQ